MIRVLYGLAFFLFSVVTQAAGSDFYRSALEYVLVSTFSPGVFEQTAFVEKINPVSGQLEIAHQEYTFPIRDLIKFDVKRVYSGDEGNSISGRRWYWSFESYLEQIDNESLRLHDWDGQSYLYHLKQPGLFVNFDLGERRIQKTTAGYEMHSGSIKYSYAPSGQIRLITGASGNQIRFEYHNDLLVRIHLYDWDDIEIQYNDQSQVSHISYPNGQQFSYEYHQGQLAQVEGAWGNTTHYSYQDGQLSAIAVSSGLEIEYEYAQSQNTVNKRTENGRSITQFSHEQTTDHINFKMERVTDKQNIKTSYSIQSDKWVVTNALGNQHKIVWHSLYTQLPIEYHSPDGRVQRWDYNNQGQLDSYSRDGTDPLIIEYGEAGYIRKIVTSRGASMVFEYEGAFLTKVSCNDEVLSQRYYNQEGLLERELNKYGNVINYTYTPSSLIQSVEVEKKGVFSFGYDSRQRVKQVQINHIPIIHVNYEDQEKRLQIQNEVTEINIDLFFGSDNILLQKMLFNDNPMTFSYDELNRLTSVGQEDALVTFGYDELNRLNLLDTMQGSRHFAYNASGHLIQFENTDNQRWRFDYDQDGNLTAINQGDSSVLTLELDSLGRKTQISTGDQLNGHFDYNAEDRLIAYKNTQLSARVLRDRNDQPVLISKTELNSSENYLLNWDDSNRLERITYPSGMEVVYRYKDNNDVDDISIQDGAANYDITLKFPKPGEQLIGFPNGIEEKNLYNRLGRIGTTKIIKEQQNVDWLEYQYNLDSTVAAVYMRDEDQEEIKPENANVASNLISTLFFDYGFGLTPLMNNGDSDFLASFLDSDNYNQLQNEVRYLSANKPGDSIGLETILPALIGIEGEVVVHPDGRVFAVKKDDNAAWFYIHYSGKIARAVTNDQGKVVALNDDLNNFYQQTAMIGGFNTGQDKTGFNVVEQLKENILEERQAKKSNLFHNVLADDLISYCSSGMPFLAQVCGIGGAENGHMTNPYRLAKQIVKNDLLGIATILDNSHALKDLTAKSWSALDENTVYIEPKPQESDDIDKELKQVDNTGKTPDTPSERPEEIDEKVDVKAVDAVDDKKQNETPVQLPQQVENIATHETKPDVEQPSQQIVPKNNNAEQGPKSKPKRIWLK